MDTTHLLDSNDNWEESKVVIIIALVICTGSVILRFWTNIVYRRKARAGEYPFEFPPPINQDLRLFTFTDHLLHAAFCCTLGISIMNIYLDIVKRPAKPTDTADTKVGEMNFATHIGWLTAMWWNSSSILLQYKRTFRDVINRCGKKFGTDLIRGLNALLFIWWLSSLLFMVFQNKLQFNVYWELGPNRAYIIRVWYTNITHIIFTVIIIMVPIRWIWLDRPKGKAILLYAVLFGALSIIVVLSIVRLCLLHRRFGAPAQDRYVWSITAVMYSVIEANVAIICTNLPALGYHFFFEWIGTNESRRPSGSTHRNALFGFQKPEPSPGPSPEQRPTDLERRYEVENDLRRQHELENTFSLELPGEQFSRT